MLNRLSSPECAAVLFMTGCTLTDLKDREINLLFCTACAVIGGISLIIDRSSLLPAISSVLPGISLFLVSLLLPGSIGGGDAIAITVLGLFLGFSQLLVSLAVSLLLAGCFSAVCLSLGTNRTKTIPFLPFLSVGVWIVLLLK